MPKSGVVDHIAMQFLGFWGTYMMFSIVAAPIHIHNNSVRGFRFLHTLSTIYYRLSNDGHSDWCEVIPPC